jgi:predicted HicB family RNase H-like nuclease
LIHGYSYRVAWSDEDKCYIATSPEFPGLSAWGDSHQEAVKEFDVVLEESIEVYKEKGWALPHPQKVQDYSGQFRLRLPKSLHAGLAERAELDGVSLNTLAVQYLAAGLEGSNNRAWIRKELRQAAMWFLGIVRDVFAARTYSESADFAPPAKLNVESRLVSSVRSTESQTFDLVPEPVRYR